MRTYLGIVRTEMRLLWRRRSFWIAQVILLLPGLIPLLMVIAMAQGDFRPRFNTPILFPLIFLLPILVGPSTTRDLSQVGDTLFSTPLDGLKHLAGITTGMFLGLLPGVLAQTILLLLVYALDGSSSPRFIWEIYLPLLLVNMALGLSLITLMGLLLRRTVVLVIIWVVFWAALSILRQGIDEFHPFQDAALININFENLKLSPTFGLGLYRPTVTGMLVWFLGVALLGLWIALILYPLLDSRRALRGKWILVLWGGVATGMVVIGGLTTHSAVRASAIPISPYDIQIDRWSVVAHTLEMSVDASTDTLQGKSTLTLTADTPFEEPLVVLKLNPGLVVVELSTDNGENLAAERIGDSLVITLPDISQEELTLNLGWRGKIQVAYPDYQMSWDFQAPLFPRTDTPQPISSLLLEGVGFFKRDGDWYPWPWTTSAHQADHNRVTIHVMGDELILPTSDSKTLHWEGAAPLPSLLLVIPPSRLLQTDGMNLYTGKMSDPPLTEQIQIYTGAVRKLWNQIGAPPPKHIVTMPYIGDILLSEDLLLVPEGSSYYLAPSISDLFGGYASSASPSQVERSLIAALTRQWIFDLVSIPTASYVQAFPRGMQPAYQIGFEALVAEDQATWKELGGRWVQPLLVPDVSYVWSPRLNVELNPPGELSAVAAWLAIELADPDVRREDLTIIQELQELNVEKRGWISGPQLRERESALLPFVLDAREAREVVLVLHEWAEELGIEQAVQLTFQTIQDTRPQRIQELFQELEARSGIPIREVKR